MDQTPQWYYSKDGQKRVGPVGTEELGRLASGGGLKAEDLVWREGMADWQPAGVATAFFRGTGPGPGSGSGMGSGIGLGSGGVGSVAGGVVSGSAAVPPTPGAEFTGVRYETGLGTATYAGFWLRFVAIIIDLIITTVANYAVQIPLMLVLGVTGGGGMGGGGRPGPVIYIGMLFSWLVSVSIPWLYFAYMESSAKQATLGKMALGLTVTDLQGQRLSFGRATGRYFGKVLSGLILCIGYMMAGWTERKQALHDMMAGTLVVKRG